MIKKLKIVAGVVGLLAIATVAFLAFWFGNGDITVVAPEESELSVQVDNKPVQKVKAGDHLRLNLEQGKHDVTVTAASGEPAKYSLNVTNGAFSQLLPASNQCFAVFDVTNLIYKKTKLSHSLSDAVVVTDKFPDKKAVDMPSGVYFSLEQLPKQIKENEKTKVLYDMPCDSLKGEDKDIIVAAGLGDE